MQLEKQQADLLKAQLRMTTEQRESYYNSVRELKQLTYLITGLPGYILEFEGDLAYRVIKNGEASHVYVHVREIIDLLEQGTPLTLENIVEYQKTKSDAKG